MSTATWDGDVAREVKRVLTEDTREWVPIDALVDEVTGNVARNEETVRNTVEELRRCGEVYGPKDKGLKVTP